MSNLLSQASLVMIPSGYKEDVVYSQIPTNGNGDLSFTRASNGTRINSAGLVEVVAWNLAEYSEDFSNAFWTKQQSSITANATTAPNGTSTADKLVEDTSNSVHRMFNNGAVAISTSDGTTYSFYLKSAGRTRAWVRDNDIVGALFNLSNGTIVSTEGTATATITSAGDGWYRCTITRVNSNGNGRLIVYLDNGTSDSYTGNGTDGVFIWGAQLNIGSTAKPYFPTTDRLNVPRLTYQNGGGGCPSLLLEKQSTNLLSYSEQFDNAAWSKTNATITANATTSPDGTQNADKLVENTSTGEHYIIRVSATSTIGVAYTLSWYMKAGERNAVSLYNYSMNNLTAIFNANTGVATYVSGGTSYSVSMESVGNGWYRCIATSNASDTNQDFALRLVQSGTTINYTGDGTSGIFIWGAQLEASSYPTSYIPTTSSSATRVADACYRNSYAAGVSTEATIFADFEYQRNDGGYSTPGLIYNGSLGNYIYLYVLGNTIRALCANGGVVQSNIVSGTVTPNTRYKVAAAYKTNDFVLYINGSLIGTDTSGTMPTFTNSGTNTYIGTDASFTEPVGKLNEAVIFPTRLTNAELASLTTI